MFLRRVVRTLSSESFHKLKLKLTFYDSAGHLNPLRLLNDRKVNPVWLHQEVEPVWSHYMELADIVLEEKH